MFQHDSASALDFLCHALARFSFSFRCSMYRFRTPASLTQRNRLRCERNSCTPTAVQPRRLQVPRRKVVIFALASERSTGPALHCTVGVCSRLHSSLRSWLHLHAGSQLLATSPTECWARNRARRYSVHFQRLDSLFRAQEWFHRWLRSLPTAQSFNAVVHRRPCGEFCPPRVE